MEHKKSWVIKENVKIGAVTLRKITPTETQIGENAVFLSNSIVYAGVKIGDNLIIGHNSVIREENVIGNNFKLWNNSNIDYGCKIGDNVKVHSNCYIAQFTTIENDVFIGPGTITTNDKYPGSKGAEQRLEGPTLKSGCQIGARVVIMPGVTIGERAVIGAGSVVTKDIPPKSIAYGNPAKVVEKTDVIKDERGKLYQ